MDNTKTPYRHAASPRMRVSTTFTDRSRTKQEFLDECDINKLLARYRDQGVPPRTNPNQPQWGDFNAFDLQDAMNQVIQAEEAFADLPSHIRARFDHDPVQLLEWVHDPKNAQEAVSLGFLDAAKLPPGWGSLPNPGNATTAATSPSKNAAKSSSEDSPT